MAYPVLNTFKETEHDGHVYQKGATYPAEGFKETKKRVEFLQKKHKKYGVPFLGTPKPEKKDDDKKEIGEKSGDKK